MHKRGILALASRWKIKKTCETQVGVKNSIADYLYYCTNNLAILT